MSALRDQNAIPIIDLFAGPGGLGEGFSRFLVNGRPAFKTVLSIEKDPAAHRTLTLRAFYRQFDPGQAPARLRPEMSSRARHSS